MKPLSVSEVMDKIKSYQTHNGAFERECFEQAKTELDLKANSGIDFISKVLTRAQEIKVQRRARGEGR